MAVEVVVRKSGKSADGKQMYSVTQIDPYEQSPQKNWSGGNHGRHKEQSTVVGDQVSPQDRSRYVAQAPVVVR